MACLDILLNVINHLKHANRVFIISGGSSAAILRCGANAIILKRLLFFWTISVRLLYGLLVLCGLHCVQFFLGRGLLLQCGYCNTTVPSATRLTHGMRETIV